MWTPIRLGAFIVGSLCILGVGVFLIGDKQFLFSSTYRLDSSFRNVSGLTPGADVRVGGIHKGAVKDILLPPNPDGPMTVVMALDRSTRRVLKQDSVASIGTDGLVGDKYVELSFGSSAAAPVKDGDTLRSVPPVELADLLTKANDALGAAQGSLGELQAIGKKINEGQGTIGALVNDKKIYQEMSDASAQAKQGAAAFQENMEALKHNWFLSGFFKQRGYEDTTELARHEVARLPTRAPLKRFVLDGKQIFEGPASAKIKNQKALDDAGHYLEQAPFGLAVVTAYNGMKGDADETRVLTQGRALVVRDYLTANFKMDDTKVKTLGLGKQARPDVGDGGAVEVIVYPPGTSAPMASATRSPAASNGRR